MTAGRVVRPLAGQEGTVPDPKGGDGVEGETPAQVIGLVEVAVLDAGADLPRMEEPLDPPAQFEPAQHRAGGVEVGLAPVASSIQCSGWFVFRFFDAGSAGRRGGSSSRAGTAILRTGGSLSRSCGGSRSTGVQRRVRFAVRPRGRFGPPAGGSLDLSPSYRVRLQHMVPQVRVSARGQRHPTLRPPDWPGPASRPGLPRTREQLPEAALAVADRYHPTVPAGAREFLRPLQAVHPADTVLVIGLTEVGVHRADHPGDVCDRSDVAFGINEPAG